jgi:hypothetical protein
LFNQLIKGKNYLQYKTCDIGIRLSNTSIPNTETTNKNYGIPKCRKLPFKRGLQMLKMCKCIAGPPVSATSAPPFHFSF